VEWTQVFGSKVICAQTVYFQHSTMPSITCLRLSDARVICHDTYFKFPIHSAFLPCMSARQHSGVLVYPISDIGRWRICRMGRFLVRSIQPRGIILNWFLTVKMETRHPVDWLFGSEFPAICNHCVVMAAWSRKTLKFCEKFVRFLEKRPLTVKLSKIQFRKFSPPHRSTLWCSNVVKCWWRKSAKSCVIYLTKTILPASQNVATARIAPIICMPGPAPNNVLIECSRFYPYRFTFGGVVTKQRVNTAKSPRKINPIWPKPILQPNNK